MNFFNRLDQIEIEGISFWIGFIAASLFWWLIIRIIPYIKKAFSVFKESIQKARESLKTGADQRLRANMLNYVQNLHMTSSLFSLDEILVQPELIPPPIPITPGQEPPLDYVADNLIPYMPDFPELSSAFNVHTIPVEDALKEGANLIITGRLGSGKTTALAYLASIFARQDPSLGELRTYLPIYLHANELLLPQDEDFELLNPVIDAISARSSTLRQASLPDVIHNSFIQGKVIFLLDGLDETPVDQLSTLSKYLESLLNEHPDIRIVAAADPNFVDGFISIGLVSIPIATWNKRRQSRFIQKWSSLWQKYIEDSTENEESPSINPILLNGWLLVNNASLSPLEFTLKVWSAYANDVRGSEGMDAIEAYIRRLSARIPRVRPALENLAMQMFLTNRSYFSQGEAQKWISDFGSGILENDHLASITNDTGEEQSTREIPIPRVLSDLTRIGLLITLPNNQLSFAHPIIPAYLTGTSTAFPDQLDAILNQPDWPIKMCAVQFLASHVDLGDEAVKLLTNTEDPLHKGVLQAGSWLRFIPKETNWRKTILQNLANMLQQEELPYNFRSRILVCLVSTNDPGINTILRHLLRSSKNSVTQLAALGCGFTMDINAVEELTQLCTDPSPVGQSACLALVNIGTKPALDEAASIMLHGDEPLRRAVAEGFAHNPEEGHPILKEGSSMDDLLIRRVSIHGLRLVKEEWAINILEEMQIEDGQWVVRDAAARVVEEINNFDPAIPDPSESFEETQWLINYANENNLDISSSDRAKELLLHILREGSPDQTLAALDIFRRNGNPGIFPAIYHLLYGEDKDIAESAYDTLWHLAATGSDIPLPIQFGLGY
jgi:energy-coupling factor transporter ATP-binding protein EcfA2